MARVPLRAGLLSTIEPAEDPRLVAGRCRECRQLHFPATASCPLCGGGDCEPATLSNRGTLYAHTVVDKPPPGYRGRVPYGFGVVELPEGIRVISRLTETRAERLAFAMPVRLVLEELFVDDAGDQIVGWAFEPESAQ